MPVPDRQESFRFGMERGLDEGIETAEERVEILGDPPWGVRDRRRVEHAAAGNDLWRQHRQLHRRPDRFEGGRDGVPRGVMTRGERLAHPRRAIAQADIALTTAGIAELGEAPILLRDNERWLTH